MSRIVQEKFECRFPIPDDDNGNSWVSDKEARNKKRLPGREGRPGGDLASKTMDNAVFHLGLPPGSDVEDQEVTDIRKQPFSMGGETDVSKDWNPEAVHRGFKHLELRPTDDMYTREHNDAFYEEVTVDGVTGFLERNNMLDRQ